VAKRKTPASKSSKSSRPVGRVSKRLTPNLYTLEVFLTSGLITERFARKNPVISRTIQMRGDQTLEDLHEAIFEAYDRFDPHLYEFQFGKRPMEGPRYVLPMTPELGDDNPYAGLVDETTIESLGLKKGRAFGYWFDFGDDWWHQINVEAIEPNIPPGKYPKITKRVGKSPPQYL
jgi:hypothetical protein